MLTRSKVTLYMVKGLWSRGHITPLPMNMSGNVVNQVCMMANVPVFLMYQCRVGFWL